MNPIEDFPTRDDLADAAALAVVEALAASGPRTLVAAGGSTPGPVYDRLARQDLAWDQVTVTLTDERWVDPGSDQSNEGLIRRRLMVEKAADARFLPLKGAGATLGYRRRRPPSPALRHALPSAPPCCWGWATTATSLRFSRVSPN